MLVRILPVLLIFTFVNSLSAQQIERCGTHIIQQELLKKHPEMKAEKDAFNQFAEEFSDNGSRELKIIPIVFHIIHTYGSENISREQVEDALRILNEDFKLLNEDQSEVVPAFQNIIGNTQFEFRLARKDPNGNCTDGITRTVSDLTFNGNDNVKELISWPRNRYFNVWIVDNVITDGGTQVGGYAYQPSNFIGDPVDGVIVTHTQFGSIGTSSSSNFASRTLTHEAGHWFNLDHTWGGSNSPGLSSNCNEDDSVNDTPNCIGVADQSCNLNQQTCGSLDNVQNYMDYSSCGLMFTTGQSNRMIAAANSNIGQRSTLWSAQNLTFTGVNNTGASACAPKADFSASTNEACVGANVTFTDESYNAEVDGSWTWNWAFPGASVTSSAAQNPVVQYAAPGTYAVTLTAANSTGSNSVTKTNYITIRPDNPVLSSPLFEGVESSSFPNLTADPFQNWKVNGSTSSFFRSTEAAATGSASIKYNNNAINTDVVSELVSPIFDCSSVVAPANMTFKVAYARKSTASSDKLVVYASNNCGRTWVPRYTKLAASLSTLASGQTISGTFIPTASQWRTETVSIPSFIGSSSCMIKFEFTDGGGNSMFIDDINFFGDASLSTQQSSIDDFSTQVIPNPATGAESRLQIGLTKSESVSVQLMDVSGKIIARKELGLLSSGEHNVNLAEFTEGDSKAGVYFVQVDAGSFAITRKWLCIE
jgi:PKD repeat protein